MTLYLDTSVLSALFDIRNRERAEITREFFAARVSDRLIVSELTLAEIRATPSEDLRRAIQEVADRFETVGVATGVDRLASRYIEAGAVAESYPADAYHIAIAVVCEANMVAGWNIRHSVRRKMRDVVNMVNIIEGHPHIILAGGRLRLSAVLRRTCRPEAPLRSLYPQWTRHRLWPRLLLPFRACRPSSWREGSP